MSSLSSRIYIDAQAACGLKVGDWVKIVDKVEEKAPEWGGWCSKNMDRTVGRVGKITGISPTSIEVRIKYSGQRFCYPYFVLEKTEQPCPFKVGDCVKVIGKGPMKSDSIAEGKFSLWRNHMDRTIGNIGIVESVPSKDCRFRESVLVQFPDGAEWQYAFGCLEKVDKPERVFKSYERVLVRDHDKEKWQCSFFSHFDKSNKEYVCAGYGWEQCIPYKGNEYLVGTTTLPKN